MTHEKSLRHLRFRSNQIEAVEYTGHHFDLAWHACVLQTFGVSEILVVEEVVVAHPDPGGRQPAQVRTPGRDGDHRVGIAEIRGPTEAVGARIPQPVVRPIARRTTAVVL